MPDADNFIAQLATGDTERVKRDIESHIEKQLHGAVGDLYRRFGEAIERVSERLREDDDGKPLVCPPARPGSLPKLYARSRSSSIAAPWPHIRRSRGSAAFSFKKNGLLRPPAAPRLAAPVPTFQRSSEPF